MDALAKIEDQKRLYVELKKSIDAELRQLRSDKLRNAKREYAKSVLDAWNAGVQNVSALARSMGTTDRKSVYDLLALAQTGTTSTVVFKTTDIELVRREGQHLTVERRHGDAYVIRFSDKEVGL